MKKLAVLLMTVLTVSMFLLALQPVEAKPYSVTVTLVDAQGNPLEGYYVWITGNWLSTSNYPTNARGKATVLIPADWTIKDGWYVYASDSQYGGTSKECYGPFSLNNRFSGRIVATYQ